MQPFTNHDGTLEDAILWWGLLEIGSQVRSLSKNVQTNTSEGRWKDRMSLTLAEAEAVIANHPGGDDHPEKVKLYTLSLLSECVHSVHVNRIYIRV